MIHYYQLYAKNICFTSVISLIISCYKCLFSITSLCRIIQSFCGLCMRPVSPNSWNEVHQQSLDIVWTGWWCLVDWLCCSSWCGQRGSDGFQSCEENYEDDGRQFNRRSTARCCWFCPHYNQHHQQASEI